MVDDMEFRTGDEIEKDQETQINTEAEQRISDAAETSGVKIATVEQDMAAMAEEAELPMFSYNEIHNSQVNNVLHYDYNKVIEGVSKMHKITPFEAEEQLLERGVLLPMPNGEYIIDVDDATREGGGCNYKGTAAFTFSNEDVETRYHEFAHSFQTKYDLFNKEKLDKMYSIAEQGLQPGDNKEDKLADRDAYRQYLREAHAEIFSHAALMLRKESAVGFSEQALYAQSYGEKRNAAGLLIGVIDNYLGKMAKLYACKPVMHATIKEIVAIRKAGKRDDYFNPDGTLNIKKLADLCEKITLKTAYSPRTYKAFMDNNFADTHTAAEKDWRKGSILAVVKMLPSKIVTDIHHFAQNIRKKLNIIKHRSLQKAEAGILKAMVEPRKMSDDPKIQAANDYAYIQAKMQIIASKSRALNIYDCIGRKMLEKIDSKETKEVDFEALAKKYYAKGSAKDFQDIYKVLQENKDNQYFQKIMENPANLAEIRREQIKAMENSAENRTQTISAPDKKRIEELSGRSGAQSAPRQANADTSIQSLYNNREDALGKPSPKIYAHQQAGTLGKKLGLLMNSLRRGRNMLSGEGMSSSKDAPQPAPTPAQSKEQITAPQQPSVAQIKMTRDKVQNR